jgi:hypothetical protein
MIIVDQFSVAYASPEGRVFSASTALNTSLNVGTAVDIRNSFDSVNLAAFARSVSLPSPGILLTMIYVLRLDRLRIAYVSRAKRLRISLSYDRCRNGRIFPH